MSLSCLCGTCSIYTAYVSPQLTAVPCFEWHQHVPFTLNTFRPNWLPFPASNDTNMFHLHCIRFAPTDCRSLLRMTPTCSIYTEYVSPQLTAVPCFEWHQHVPFTLNTFRPNWLPFPASNDTNMFHLHWIRFAPTDCRSLLRMTPTCSIYIYVSPQLTAVPCFEWHQHVPFTYTFRPNWLPFSASNDTNMFHLHCIRFALTDCRSLLRMTPTCSIYTYVSP